VPEEVDSKEPKKKKAKIAMTPDANMPTFFKRVW